MAETLQDVGKHSGTWGDGHYEATVLDNGSVTITTILDNAQQTYTVKLTHGQWNRLAAWVVWARAEWEQSK